MYFQRSSYYYYFLLFSLQQHSFRVLSIFSLYVYLYEHLRSRSPFAFLFFLLVFSFIIVLVVVVAIVVKFNFVKFRLHCDFKYEAHTKYLYYINAFFGANCIVYIHLDILFDICECSFFSRNFS